ncbi:MAG: AAA domain-containing protein [Actinomycetota bacterium]|nr:AAA domain-containing protein [Actinomycetota bacterium]
MGWPDEIRTVLEEWIAALGGERGGEGWQRVGTARTMGTPKLYAVDIRGMDLTADQADNLRLAGPEQRSIRGGFPIMEATVDGELLRVRVAEYAAPAEPYVWRLRQKPAFLVTVLRDGLSALGDAGLANLLARGEAGGVPADVIPPPWTKGVPAQQDTYRACLGSGLWLVWGPPGTGKTRLLQAAVSGHGIAGRIRAHDGRDEQRADPVRAIGRGWPAGDRGRPQGTCGATSATVEAAHARGLWAEVEGREAELTRVEAAALQGEARALVAGNACTAIEEEIAALHQPGGKVRRRDRNALREAERRLGAARPGCERLRAAAARARGIAGAFREATEAAVAEITSLAELTREEIRHRDTTAAHGNARLHDLEQAQLAGLDRLAELRVAQATAHAAEELVTICTRRGWPGMDARASVLRGGVARHKARRRTVEERHTKLQRQYDKLARDAQGEIIRSARLVATTLARFRTNKAVLDGPCDVVLIDEVGAATMPEVLLAVSKASRCAVLLGDFMQLGPVLPSALEDSDRADIRRWLATDAFRHCGITTPADALDHPACLVLDTQHRFGPHVMQLANLLAYDGLLKPGKVLRSHAADDPEIVLIDTDGLHELTQVHRVTSNAGWWAAGVLLARALVEVHAENGETTGVVTPYVIQAEATLEALRDVEPGGRPLAEVGTAHRFQGREFPSSSSTRSSPGTAAACGWARLPGFRAALRGSTRACDFLTWLPPGSSTVST